MYIDNLILVLLVVYVKCNKNIDAVNRIIRNIGSDDDLDETSISIDASLNQEDVSESSPIQEGYYIQPIYFHTNDCTVSTFDLKMTNQRIKYVSKTNLPRRTISLKVLPTYIWIDGKFEIDRLFLKDTYSKATGSFRVTITDLQCEGVAAIVTGSCLSIEWLQLFCDHKRSTTTTQITRTFERGSFVERYLEEKFGKDINDHLERDIADGLEVLTTSWLTKRLDGMSKIIRQNAKMKSQDYKENSQQEEVDANDILDGVLGFAVSLIKDHYNDTIKIPDIREGFEKNIFHLVKVGAQFLATDGTAKDLSSISRYGNARIQRKNQTIYFLGGLQFQKLNIMYRRYRAELVGIGPSGSITATVAPVGVRMVIHVDFGNTRKIYIDRFRIAEAGKITVRVTGIGRIIDKIVSTITTWVVAMFKTKILSLVQERVVSYAKKTLRNATIDDIITGRLPL